MTLGSRTISSGLNPVLKIDDAALPPPRRRGEKSAGTTMANDTWAADRALGVGIGAGEAFWDEGV
jgi:hypothetical protein